MSTVARLLADAAAVLAAAAIENPRFEARLLLEAATGKDRTSLVTAPGLEVRDAEAEAFRRLVQRRARREPMAYILGRAEFWSLEFEVGPGVLVPRPDTETLVERALQRVSAAGSAFAAARIGAGSGCLGITLLRLFPAATAVATDLSRVALGWARRNARRLGVSPRLLLVQSRWASAAAGPFDLVVSNPPYIASAGIDRLMPDVRAFEPRLALDGGPDGLGAYRAILGDLPRLLAPEGLALLEVGHDQAGPVAALASGWRVASHPDLAGVSRCLELAGGS